MILITGATGHVGKVLVKKLLESNNKLRLFVRDTSKLSGLDQTRFEIVKGDITDLKSLIRATQGVEKVYHLASKITLMPGNEEFVHNINVNGTKNVIKACQKNNVDKLLYVSSIHAIQEPPHGEKVTEELPFAINSSRGVYDKTKAKASVAVKEAAKNSTLKTVLVCPTGIIGPEDHRPSLFGANMINHVKNGTPAYFKGKYDYVDVRDVVNGMITAMEKGRNGEHYILSGEQLSLTTYYEYLEELSGQKVPTRIIPYWLAILIANIMVKTQKHPQLTPYSVKTLVSNCNISHEKSTNELGYSPRSVKTSIIDQFNWFKNNGYFD